MYWQMRLLTFKEVVRISAATVLVVAIGAAMVAFGGRWGNAGFGPEWECMNPGQGPVCIKRIATSGNHPTEAPASIRSN